MNEPLFSNPIISAAQLVISGSLPQEQAARQIADDADLAGMSDDMLAAHVFEARTATLKSILDTSSAVMVYAELMLACTARRVNALEGHCKVSGAGGGEFGARLARWYGILADCFLLNGIASLCMAVPTAALVLFDQAELAARSLPDEGRLRLRSVLAVWFGRGACAAMLRNQDLARQADAAINDLVHNTGRRAEAEAYVAEIRQEFDLVRCAIAARAQFRTAASDPDRLYDSILEQIARAVENGQVSLDQARTLMDYYPSVNWGTVHSTSVHHHALARHSSAASEIRANLNYRVAQRFEHELARTRGDCAFVLGAAIMDANRAGAHEARGKAYGNASPEAYQRAVPYLAEAVRFYDADDTLLSRRTAASAAFRLGKCAEGLKQYEEAKTHFRDAIGRFDRLAIADPANANAYHAELIAAEGNLASLKQATEDSFAILNSQYELALRFLEVGDTQRARQSLLMLTDSSQRANHYDRALAAAEELTSLLRRGGDIEGTVDILLDMARLSATARSPAASMALLDRADSILVKPVRHDAKPRYHAQRAESLRIRGVILTNEYLLTRSESARKDAASAFEHAEAEAQHSDDRNLTAAILYASAHLTEDSARVEELAEKIRKLPCSGVWHDRTSGLIGIARLSQKRYAEAIDLLSVALASHDETPLSSALAHFRLAKAYLGVDDHQAAVTELVKAAEIIERGRHGLLEEGRIRTREMIEPIYEHLIAIYTAPDSGVKNSAQGWQWLERAKCRTLVDDLAFAGLALPHASTEIAELVERESGLLQRIRPVRVRLLTAAPNAEHRLGDVEQMHVLEHGLRIVWQELGRVAPEYVKMRTGETITWDELQDLFGWELDPVVVK